MPPTDENKKVRPRSTEELQAIEDRLLTLATKFRDIRAGMKGADMESVTLALGTFTHFLGKLEPLAEEYLGKFNAQRVQKHTADHREKLRPGRVAAGKVKPKK